MKEGGREQGTEIEGKLERAGCVSYYYLSICAASRASSVVQLLLLLPTGIFWEQLLCYNSNTAISTPSPSTTASLEPLPFR